MSFPILLILPIPVILTLLVFLSQRAHLLMVLLTTESILLTLILLITLTHALSPQSNPFFLLFFLTMGACEASLGLALLVAMSRSFGSDMLTSLTLNKC